jgi:thiol-disulfide isomerase/thioredoxin
MKHVLIAFSVFLAAAAIGFGQSMMSTGNSNGSASGMVAPNDSNGGATSMMSANGESAGTGTSMMSASPMKADPAVGNKLRFASSTGTKVIFTTLEAAEALAAKQPTVLFFAADWCPYCQADLKDINANGSRLGNVAIVVANYDTARKLKDRYGITVQDTFVQIDSSGAVKAIWNGGGAGVDAILSHIVRS